MYIVSRRSSPVSVLSRQSMLGDLGREEMWPVIEDGRGGRAFIELSEAGSGVYLVKVEEASVGKECTVAYRFCYRDFDQCIDDDWHLATLGEAVDATIEKVVECRRLLYGDG